MVGLRIAEGIRPDRWNVLGGGALSVWRSDPMMIVEIAAGISFGSMALLADDWHMSTHVATLPSPAGTDNLPR